MEQALTSLARWPIAGLAISVVAVLTFWSQNQMRLAWESAWPTLAIVLLLFSVITLIFRLCFDRWQRAGIASGLTAVYVFYAPAIAAWLHGPRSALLLINVGAGLLLVLLFRLLPKAPERFDFVAGRLNILCLLLLAGTAAPLIVSQARMEPARDEAQSRLGQLAGHATLDSPDVWHLIFDRYASRETLRSRYGFDNESFLGALRERGFVVQEPAFSNYQRTGHSVASTMNGSLLNSMAGPMSRTPADWVPIYRSMRDSAAIRAFNRMGYETIFAGSWWEPTRFSRIASRSIQIRAMPQLARVILENSSFGLWLEGNSLPWLNGRADQCFRANEKFKRLNSIARETAQKQVFAHFLVPHPPFVLNEDGTCRTLAKAKADSRSQNYTAQIEFVNRKTIELIDSILAGPRPAVIVIHSDEGPWPEPYVGNEHGLGTDPVPVPWDKLPSDKLREKMGILLAVRDPSGNPPQTMPTSPVQIYPAILRDHFASQAPIPPSRHFVFTSDRTLFDFAPVDAQLEIVATSSE